MSSHSADAASFPSLDSGTFWQVPRLGGLSPVLDEVRTNSWLPDIPACTTSGQINESALPLGLQPLIRSIIFQVIREGAGALHPEIPLVGIHKESYKRPVPSLRGYEVARSAVSLTPNDDVAPASVDDRIRDLSQERGSKKVSLDHGHRHTHFHTTSSNISALSTLPVVPFGKNVVQDGVSRERFHQFQTTGRDLAAAISRPSLRPGEKREKRGAPQGRYSCSICKLVYAQPQGLTRHQREKHKARLCMYCDYSYGRPYLFREHLLRKHPGIDPNAAINEAIGSFCGTTIRRRSRAQSQVFPSCLASSLPAVASLAKLTPVVLPDISSIADDPRPGSTELATKELRKHEDVYPLELSNPTGDYATSSSTEEPAQPATKLGMSARAVQIWFQDKAQAVGAVGFIAVDGPSTPAPAPAPVPAPAPLVIRYGDSLVDVSPVVEPSVHTHSYHSPPASAPVPSSPIWHSWSDIYPRGDWA